MTWAGTEPRNATSAQQVEQSDTSQKTTVFTCRKMRRFIGILLCNLPVQLHWPPR